MDLEVVRFGDALEENSPSLNLHSSPPASYSCTLNVVSSVNVSNVHIAYKSTRLV
jgi:hypothetical protein